MDGGAPGSTTQRGGRIAGAVLLLALVLVVYGRSVLPGSRFDWVFDDFRFIVRNDRLAAPLDVAAAFTDPGSADPRSPTGIVRPLRTLSFALDRHWFGLSPLAFRAHSLLWFAAASISVWALLRRLVPSPSAALLGAAVWTVHPMQTECVAWVSSRGDLMMVACAALSLRSAILRRRSARPVHLAASLALAALSMLAKETAVVVPILVVAVSAIVGDRSPFVRRVLAAWPWMLVSLVYWFGYRALVQSGATSHVATFVLGGSTEGTAATMSRAFAFVYPAFSVLPVRPVVDWYLPTAASVLLPSAFAALTVLAATVAATTRGLVRGSAAAGCAALFFAPLLPVANWPFSIGIPTAERFLSLPLVGLVCAVAIVTAGRRALRTPVWIAVAAMAAISWHRVADWRSDESLWRSTSAAFVTPRAEGYAAAEALDAGFAALRASEATPDPADKARLAASARAGFTEARDRALGAIRAWNAAESVEFSASHVVLAPRSTLSNACYHLGDIDGALGHAMLALQVSDEALPRPHYNAALAWIALNRGGSAIRALERAIDLEMAKVASSAPDELGRILLHSADLAEREGETELARLAIDRALRLGAGPAAARGAAFEARVGALLLDLRSAAASDPRGRAALAVALAADGRIEEAERVRRSAIADGDANGGVDGGAWPRTAEALWVHARHECRPGYVGLRAAKAAYGALLRAAGTSAADEAEIRFRIALVDETLGSWTEETAAAFDAAAARLPEGEPRGDYARAAAARVRRFASRRDALLEVR